MIAAAALVAVLTGCKYEPSSVTYTHNAPIWSEVVSGGETVRTTNTYDGETNGMRKIVAVEQTKNGATVHKDTNFKYESPYITSPTEFTRTITLPSSATELYKSTYSDKGIQVTYEVFRNGEATPSQWMKRELNTSGQIFRQESLLDGVHSVFTNYQTYEQSGRVMSYDALVTTDGVSVSTIVRETFTSNERTTMTQREVFAGEKRIELEVWGTIGAYLDGSYKKWVGTNITSVNGQPDGATLVVDQTATTTVVSGNNFTNTSTRKEYENGTLVKESTLRAFFEQRKFTI